MKPHLSCVNSTVSLLDYRAVESGIEEHLKAEFSRSSAFVRYILDNHFHVEATEFDRYIVDGGNDRGVDLIYIDHENRIINLGTCKTVSNFSKSKKNFPGNEIDKLLTIVSDIYLKNDLAFTSANSNLLRLVSEIWEILQSDDYTFVVHLFSNQLTLTPHERDRLANGLALHRVKLKEHGLYELAHGVVRNFRPRFRKTLKPTDRCLFEIDEPNLRGLHGRFALMDLCKFLHGSDRALFDDRLLSSNVRYFLGSDNEVNREIRATLAEGRSSEFWFLNNGITIVCDQILGERNGCHALTLVNPQIVNGGQTARTVFDFYAGNIDVCMGASVAIKIIETRDERLIERIAISSNTQSRIMTRDLRANDDLQLRLAQALRSDGIFYRRKRGERAPAHMEILESLRAAQILLAYQNGDPTKAKTNSNDIFGDLYGTVFHSEDFSLDVLIAGFRCYNEIEMIRQGAISRQLRISRTMYSEEWIIEGGLHVLFAVGELLRVKSLHKGNVEEALSHIPEALKVVSEFSRAHRGTPAYRLFRLSSTRTRIAIEIAKLAPASPANPVQLELRV